MALVVKKTWRGWTAYCQFPEIKANGKEVSDVLLDVLTMTTSKRRTLEGQLLQAQLNGDYQMVAAINELLREVNQLFGEIAAKQRYYYD